ncbi:MAG: hypothetical protein ACI4I2_12950 [Oscillospiraceae bacterium]
MTDRELLEELLNIQKEMMSNQKEMMGRQESMEKDISSIKIALENDIYPSIKMLSELQLENSKRLIRLERDVQSITDNIAIDEVLNNIKMN